MQLKNRHRVYSCDLAVASLESGVSVAFAASYSCVYWVLACVLFLSRQSPASVVSKQYASLRCVRYWVETRVNGFYRYML